VTVNGGNGAGHPADCKPVGWL